MNFLPLLLALASVGSMGKTTESYAVARQIEEERIKEEENEERNKSIAFYFDNSNLKARHIYPEILQS